MTRISSGRRFCALIALVFFAFSVHAGLVTIEWSWRAADDEITVFRYRLNDQEWVRVDSSVTSYVLEGVDEELVYRFEIQQSYDGENFSTSSTYEYPGIQEASEKASAEFDSSPEVIDSPPEMIGTAPEVIDAPPEMITMAPEVIESPPEVIDSAPMMISDPVEESAVIGEPAVIEEELVFEEDVIPEDEVPQTELPEAEDTTEVVETTAETPQVEQLTPMSEDELIEALDSNPSMAVELFIGTGGKGDNVFLSDLFDSDDVYTDLRTRILPSFTFEYVYPGIATFTPDSYLSLRAGIGFTLYEEGVSGDSVIAPDIRAGVSYTRRFSERWSADAALGLSVMFTDKDLSAGSQANLFYGPYVALIGRYDISEVFSIAAMAETRFLMSDLFTPYELTGIVRLGVTYRF
ncbi:MAG: hypothetical protein JXK93_06585 [Sphaerochaetaceae bacterium]|nr:hypothetical protein [Sphaerochaetaceae bacterium]